MEEKILKEMIERFFDDIAHVVVSKAVKNVFADFFVGNERIVAQNLKLMRHGRLGHTEKLRNSAHTHRRFIDGKQNAHTGRVAKDLEKVGEVVERFVTRHKGTCGGYCFIVVVAFAGVFFPFYCFFH